MIREYRIKETYKTFSIEIKAYKLKGFIFKKKVWDWYPTNQHGGVLQTYPVPQQLSDTFTNLKDAKKQIRDWLGFPIYHYNL
jgi:hypothetical protein